MWGREPIAVGESLWAAAPSVTVASLEHHYLCSHFRGFVRSLWGIPGRKECTPQITT